MTARQDLAQYWDDIIGRWLAGDNTLPPELADWYASYRGAGRGAPTLDGIPEPYGGDVLGATHEPRVALLGLNPGGFDQTFQSRTGLFADEIRAAGAHSAWLTSWPYLRSPWLDAHPDPIPFVRDRVTFARRWLDDPAADLPDLFTIELYPWHSTGVTARMSPPPDAANRFVWPAIAEIDTELIWAFGADWQRVADHLQLRHVAAYGRGGTDIGLTVPSRAVRVYALPFGQRLVVAWHSGSAGPPNLRDLEALRNALGH